MNFRVKSKNKLERYIKNGMKIVINHMIDFIENIMLP